MQSIHNSKHNKKLVNKTNNKPSNGEHNDSGLESFLMNVSMWNMYIQSLININQT